MIWEGNDFKERKRTLEGEKANPRESGESEK